MKPQLISIRGNANTGKSSVAVSVHNLLVDLYKLNVQEIQYNHDVDAILLIGDKKVAFVSEGDIAQKLHDKLQEKKEQNPDIIIICLRSMDCDGSSLRMMVETEPELFNDRIEAWTSYSNIDDMKIPLDQAVAKVIVRKIVEILK